MVNILVKSNHILKITSRQLLMSIALVGQQTFRGLICGFIQVNYSLEIAYLQGFV
jgi:hypothetical protein